MNNGFTPEKLREQLLRLNELDALLGSHPDRSVYAVRALYIERLSLQDGVRLRLEMNVVRGLVQLYEALMADLEGAAQVKQASSQIDAAGLASIIQRLLKNKRNAYRALDSIDVAALPAEAVTYVVLARKHIGGMDKPLEELVRYTRAPGTD